VGRNRIDRRVVLGDLERAIHWRYSRQKEKVKEGGHRRSGEIHSSAIESMKKEGAICCLVTASMTRTNRGILVPSKDLGHR